MKIFRLEKRITLWILIPMSLVILFLSLSTLLYFVFFYKDTVKHYSENIISNHKDSLLQANNLLAHSISNVFLQVAVNFILVAGNLIEKNLVNESLAIKSNFTGRNNYVNSVLFDNETEKAAGLIESLNTSFECAA